MRLFELTKKELAGMRDVKKIGSRNKRNLW